MTEIFGMPVFLLVIVKRPGTYFLQEKGLVPNGASLRGRSTVFASVRDLLHFVPWSSQ
jgi:hypothetical protein